MISDGTTKHVAFFYDNAAEAIQLSIFSQFGLMIL